MDITTVETDGADGWRLHGRFVQPQGQFRGLVVAGHAMMVDGRTLLSPHRPCLANALVEQGFAVLAVDLRGHGRSGPGAAQGGQWNYADLVADTAAWWQLALALAQGRPIAWLGHSLFGHVSLAWFGQHPDAAPAAYVAIAVNVWARQFEGNPLVWAAQRSVMAAAAGLVRVTGRMPARKLRMGSADESAAFWLDMARFARTNRWQSAQGVDYLAGLAQLPCPLLCVVSDGDRLYTRPDEGLAFVATVPQVETLRLGPHCTEPELADLAPDHMALATSASSGPLWHWIARWLVARIAPA